MLKEIGSNFWIAPEEFKPGVTLIETSSFGCRGEDYVWLSTGRSAIRLVLKTIEERSPLINKVALIPSFTCHTVIEPFLEYGYELHAIPLNDKISSTIEDICCLITAVNPCIIFIHRYFGFETLPAFNTIVDFIREKNIIIIEDCTQSLYSSFERIDADYYVGSIRKWCGVPDGGFAVCKHGVFQNKPFLKDENLETAKNLASELKYKYIFNSQGDKPTFKQKYREAEQLLDDQRGFFTISDTSVMIQSNLNIESLKASRRNNYALLFKGLRGIQGIEFAYDILPDDVVPLYFPIFVDDRQALQSYLADNDIYAPVIWPKATCCPKVNEAVNYAYDHLLCLPIDQRYGKEEMEKMIKAITLWGKK